MSAQPMIFTTPPKEFRPSLFAAGVFVAHADSVLLVQVNTHKEESGRWGIPGGKNQAGETTEETAKRELYEECGVLIPPDQCLFLSSELWVRKPTIEYKFDTFAIEFEHRPTVTLSEEHEIFCWVPFDKIETLPLMQGAQELLAASIEKFTHFSLPSSPLL